MGTFADPNKVENEENRKSSPRETHVGGKHDNGVDNHEHLSGPNGSGSRVM